MSANSGQYSQATRAQGSLPFTTGRNVNHTLSRWLKVDAAGAEDAFLDLVRGVDRKPFASLDGLRNAQRFLRSRKPKIGDVKPEDVIDNRLMRKLDESGFIDKLYTFYGASPK